MSDIIEPFEPSSIDRALQCDCANWETQVCDLCQVIRPAFMELKDKYYELIFAVGKKYAGETRHETALRYIRRAEFHDHDVPDTSSDEHI